MKLKQACGPIKYIRYIHQFDRNWVIFEFHVLPTGKKIQTATIIIMIWTSPLSNGECWQASKCVQSERLFHGKTNKDINSSLIFDVDSCSERSANRHRHYNHHHHHDDQMMNIATGFSLVFFVIRCTVVSCKYHRIRVPRTVQIEFGATEHIFISINPISNSIILLISKIFIQNF